MFKKGDTVEILPEFQDAGDSDFKWVVLEDEEKGRVDICPVDINMRIKPRYTVQTSQIRRLEPPADQDGTGMSKDTQVLAREFSAALRALLSADQMQMVIERNAEETNPRICHSHDFCDANVVLLEVFLSHGMDPADEGGMERWGGLWDATWNLAKAQKFELDGAHLQEEFRNAGS